MKKDVKKIVITIIVAYSLAPIIAFAVLLLMQDKVLFHPGHDEVSYNKLLNDEDYDEVKIDKDGKTLSGWIRYNSRTEKSPLLIFFYGNAQNSSNAMNRMFRAIRSCYDGYSVISVDYPEYGLTEGKLTEKELFENALLVYDYSKNLELVDKDNIVVMGYSIGTGMATYTASQRDVNGLILVAPYDEIISVYNANFPIFFGPFRMLAKYKLESKKYAEDVEVSPLIITSYADEIINHNFSERLAEHFKNVDELVIKKEIKHAGYFNNGDVLERIYNYLQNR